MVVDFSFPIFILFAVNRDEDIVRESWWGHCPWIVMKTLSVNRDEDIVRESWWRHCPWIIFNQKYFTFFMKSSIRFH